MANCGNTYYSDLFNEPNCSVPRLSQATPGGIFVGADGSIYILVDTDPCNLSHWDFLGGCCVSYSDSSVDFQVCCNEEVTFTSSDGTVTITGNIGAKTLDFSITIDTFYGSGVPIITPNDQAIVNFYLNTDDNTVFVWSPDDLAWHAIGGLDLILPTGNYTFDINGLTGTLDGTSSHSGVDGSALAYLWSGSGAGIPVFGTPTANITTVTFPNSGTYTVTLTVTNGYGNSHIYKRILKIDPKGNCEILFEIPDIAFADPANPLDSEVETWITTNGPFNNRTILFLVGSGTTLNPEFIWWYTCD